MKNKLTTTQCIQQAKDLGIPIYGDTSFRGKCLVEDDELINFHLWATYNYPQYEHLMFHPGNEWRPNNKSTSYNHYNIMLKKGLKPRLADWICLPIKQGAPAFLCELKRQDIQKSLNSRDRKKHFIEQIELLRSQSLNGALVCVSLGFEAAKVAFIEYLQECEK